MYEFNKKQKIIMVIVVSMIIIAFLYYIYTKDNSTYVSEEEIIEQNRVDNTKEDVAQEEKQKIVVHVSGAVNKEGVFELDENSRIADAVQQAEGLKENADTKNINLAFKLEDGMKIYIPTIGENVEETVGETQNDETSKYVIPSNGEAQDKERNGKVNINTASQTQLETLPSIGPATSLKIINYREEHGDFQSIEDLKEVSGIGDAKYENIKDLICVK